MKQVWRAAMAVAAAITVIGPFSAGSLAQAAPSDTNCSTVSDGDTVRGNLVVDRGDDWCNLEGITVEGDVIIGEYAQVFGRDNVFRGNVSLMDGGAGFRVWNSRIAGNIEGENPDVVELDDSTVEGDYRGIWDNADYRPRSDDPVAFNASGSTIKGDVITDFGSMDKMDRIVGVRDTSISGDLTVINSASFRVVRSRIDGGLTADQMEVIYPDYGVRITGSRVRGDTSLSNLKTLSLLNYGGGIQVGAATSRAKKDGNWFGGNVDISNSTVGAMGDGSQDPLIFSGNYVQGDVSGQGNDPKPTVERNRIIGERSGQFAG